MIFLIISITTMLVIRSYFIVKDHRNNVFSDGDAVIHLQYVKEYYKKNGSPIDMSDRYILDFSDYPTGFHKIFYYLKVPLSFIEVRGGIFTLIPDVIYTMMLFDAIGRFGAGSYYLLLFVPFLRCFFGSDARASHFNERSFGVLFGSAFLYAQSGYYIDNGFHWVLIGLASFSIASVTSKFALQAMTLYSIALSVLMADAGFLLLYIAALFFSIIVSNGYSKKVIEGLLRHSAFYREHLASRHYGLKNNYKELVSAVSNGNFIGTVTNSPVLKFITDVPLTIPFIYIIFNSLALDYWAVFWICACAFVIVISSEQLKFIGEPERYLEFALPAVFVSVSNNMENMPTLLLTAAIALSLYICISHYLNYYKRLVSGSGRVEEVVSLVNFVEKSSPNVILTIPLRISFMLGYHCCKKIKFVSNFVNIGVGENKEHYRELIPDVYPFVSSNFVALCKKYKVDYIVVDKRAVAYLHSIKPNYYYRFNKHHIIYETETIMVVNPYISCAPE